MNGWGQAVSPPAHTGKLVLGPYDAFTAGPGNLQTPSATPSQTLIPCAILCARNLTSSVLGLYSEWSSRPQGPASGAPSRLRLLLPKALPCHLLPRVSCLMTSIATWVPSPHLSPETQDPQGIPPRPAPASSHVHYPNHSFVHPALERQAPTSELPTSFRSASALCG